MLADSLPAEPPGQPKNTGVGSLFLLHGIFLTQELNWGLLHYRRILYQLSYQGSTNLSLTSTKVINDTTSGLETQQTSLTNLARVVLD